jgi:tryptophan-rich sensory protein
MKINIILISLVSVLLAFFTIRNNKKHFKEQIVLISKPGFFKGFSWNFLIEVWLLVRVMTTFSLLWFWNLPVHGKLHYPVLIVFALIVAIEFHIKKLSIQSLDLTRAIRFALTALVLCALNFILMYQVSNVAALLFIPQIVWFGILYKILSDVKTTYLKHGDAKQGVEKNRNAKI